MLHLVVVALLGIALGTYGTWEWYDRHEIPRRSFARLIRAWGDTTANTPTMKRGWQCWQSCSGIFGALE